MVMYMVSEHYFSYIYLKFQMMKRKASKILMTLCLLGVLTTVSAGYKGMTKQVSAQDEAIQTQTANPISPTGIVENTPFNMRWSVGTNPIRYQIRIDGGVSPGGIHWRSGPIAGQTYTVNTGQFKFRPGYLYRWRVRECYDLTCTNTSDWSRIEDFWWRRNFSCVPVIVAPEDGAVVEYMPLKIDMWSCPPQIMDEGAWWVNVRIQGPGVDYDEYSIIDEYGFSFDGYVLEEGAEYELKVRRCNPMSDGTYSCAGWTETRTFTWQPAWEAPDLLYPADGSVVHGYPFIFRWTEVPGTYAYEWDIHGSGDDTLAGTLTRPYTIMWGYEDYFEDGDTYYWKARSCKWTDDGYRCGPYSDVWSMTWYE